MSDTLGDVERDFYSRERLKNHKEIRDIFFNDCETTKKQLGKKYHISYEDRNYFYNLFIENLPISSDTGFYESRKLLADCDKYINGFSTDIKPNNIDKKDIRDSYYTLKKVINNYYKNCCSIIEKGEKFKYKYKFKKVAKEILSRKVRRIKNFLSDNIEEISRRILRNLKDTKLKQSRLLTDLIKENIEDTYFEKKNVIDCPVCGKQKIVREIRNYEFAHICAYADGGETIEQNFALTCNRCNSDMNKLDMRLYCIKNNKILGLNYGAGLKNLDKVPKYSKYHTEDLRKLNSIEKVTDLFNEPPNKRIRITR